MTILDRALLAAAEASRMTRNNDDRCHTCVLGMPGHANAPSWHGLPCPMCACRGAWADVPDAWLTPSIPMADEGDVA